MRVTKTALLLIIEAFTAFLVPASGQPPAWIADLPTGEAWIAHMAQDMAPFYAMPSALGNPVGEFPSTRCDDGSVPDPKKTCIPIAGNSYLAAPNRYLVSMSRQTFGYGVAYHMTGDVRYLNWMKAGVDVLRKQFIDRSSGGMYLQKDLTTGVWGPDAAFRDPQQLGYGLLGMAFYYYLTRDDAVLPDIIAVQRYIYSSHWNVQLGSMQWLLQSQGSNAYDQLQITACLDQMNTYLVLLAPIVPEPYATEMKNEMRVLLKSMLSIFYVPSANLFFTAANSPSDTDPAQTGVDAGHTSKALWMSRFSGAILGDPNLAAWAESAATRHLARSWIESDGSWAGAYLPGGAQDKNKNWWVYSELDQLAGTLSLTNPDIGKNLPRSAAYWMTYFVDHQYGDVWNGVTYGTNLPQKDFPKVWQWKNAYHAFEHALVGYIQAEQIRQAEFPLYYAFTREISAVQIAPYYLSAPVKQIDTTGSGLQKVTFMGAAAYNPPLRAVSAASFAAAPLAPGSAATVFSAPLNSSVSVTDQTGTTLAAAVTASTAGQVNFIVPMKSAVGPATITITPPTGTALTATTTIAPVSPSLFQIDSNALAAANVVRVRVNGSVTYEPVTAGITFGASTDQVYLSLYGTGFRGASVVKATLRGQDVPVLYAGSQGSSGLDQINIGPLPRSFAGRGHVTILITADNLTANPVQAEFLP